MSSIPPTISLEEQDALEGMFFSEFDIGLYLKQDLRAKQLAIYLNAYILQAYRIGKET